MKEKLEIGKLEIRNGEGSRLPIGDTADCQSALRGKGMGDGVLSLVSLWMVVVMGVSVLLGLGMTGCTSTVIPKVAEAKEASWVGTNQNSGFICFTNGGALIVPYEYERYVALRGVYGTRFKPALVDDTGLKRVGENWWIDGQHLGYFDLMIWWERKK